MAGTISGTGTAWGRASGGCVPCKCPGPPAHHPLWGHSCSPALSLPCPSADTSTALWAVSHPLVSKFSGQRLLAELLQAPGTPLVLAIWTGSCWRSLGMPWGPWLHPNPFPFPPFLLLERAGMSRPLFPGDTGALSPATAQRLWFSRATPSCPRQEPIRAIISKCIREGANDSPADKEGQHAYTQN